MKATRFSTGYPLFVLAAVAALFLALALPRASAADQYDPLEAGHPLRIAAYIAHPVGVLFDYALMRPAFWIVQREPFKTIFGYESYTRGVETE